MPGTLCRVPCCDPSRDDRERSSGEKSRRVAVVAIPPGMIGNAHTGQLPDYHVSCDPSRDDREPGTVEDDDTVVILLRSLQG